MSCLICAAVYLAGQQGDLLTDTLLAKRALDFAEKLTVTDCSLLLSLCDEISRPQRLACLPAWGIRLARGRLDPRRDYAYARLLPQPGARASTDRVAQGPWSVGVSIVSSFSILAYPFAAMPRLVRTHPEKSRVTTLIVLGCLVPEL
jgi:hypothetical protein